MLVEVRKCPLSLRPDVRLMDAYVAGRLHAVLVVEAWNPKHYLRVVQVPSSEFDAMAERRPHSYGVAEFLNYITS